MRLVDDSAYAAFRALALVSRRLPRPWSRALWRGLAWTAGNVLRIRRRVVDRQLEACFPDLTHCERDRTAQGVYDHLGRCAAELLGGSGAGAAMVVRVQPGWEVVDEALAEGRGAIVAAAHLGNFEWGGRVLADRYRLLDVVKPLRNRRFDLWLQEERRRHGIGTVTADGAASAVLGHLRAGGLVTLLLDQDAGAGGVRVPFLGRDASAWPGAARFSLQTGCPVIPMGIIRQSDDSHVLHIGPPLRPAGREASAEGIRAYTGDISLAVEVFVRRAPEQWFWVHRRWKEVERAGCGDLSGPAS